MNVFRVVKDKDYTTINNTIFKDKSISCKTKGFFATIMSLPPTWDFSVNGIKEILLEGKSSVYSFIDELEANGYLTKTTVRNESGKILGVDYTFFETPINKGLNPQPDLQETALQETAKPDVVNQPQLSTNIIKDLNNKILLSEVDRDGLNEANKIYFDIAVGFKRLFIHNKKALGVSDFRDQENATFKGYVTPIRLAFEKDKRTRDDFAKVFEFLKSDEFWMKNIMSTSKLKEKMGDLLIKASKLAPKAVRLPDDWYSRELTTEQQALLSPEQLKRWKENKVRLGVEGGYLKPIER